MQHLEYLGKARSTTMYGKIMGNVDAAFVLRLLYRFVIDFDKLVKCVLQQSQRSLYANHDIVTFVCVDNDPCSGSCCYCCEILWCSWRRLWWWWSCYRCFWTWWWWWRLTCCSACRWTATWTTCSRTCATDSTSSRCWRCFLANTSWVHFNNNNRLTDDKQWKSSNVKGTWDIFIASECYAASGVWVTFFSYIINAGSTEAASLSDVSPMTLMLIWLAIILSLRWKTLV